MSLVLNLVHSQEQSPYYTETPPPTSTPRGLEITLGVESIELPDISWNEDEEICVDLKEKINDFDPDGSTANQKTLAYLIFKFNFFSYMLFDDSDMCEGLCIDVDNGFGLLQDPFDPTVTIYGNALKGECFEENSFNSGSYIVDNCYRNIDLEDDTGYEIILQICSHCNSCNSDEESKTILWWEDSIALEPDEVTTCGDNPMFNLFYIDFITCSETLDCNNWPST